MSFNTKIGNVGIKIDTTRINKNLREAQKALNIAVRDDCEPFVPHLNGGLRDSFKFGNDDVYSGFVEYDAKYAHYQYMGELYLAANGSSWAGKYEKKYPSGKPLQYHEPGTGRKWFESAKQKNLQKWVNIVKDEVGKE